MKSAYPGKYLYRACLRTLRNGELWFSDSAIGLMQSGYPVGSTIGLSDSATFYNASWSHRHFATLASIAGAAALVQLVIFAPGVGVPCARFQVFVFPVFLLFRKAG